MKEKFIVLIFIIGLVFLSGCVIDPNSSLNNKSNTTEGLNDTNISVENNTCVWAFDELSPDKECAKYCGMWMFPSANEDILPEINVKK